MDYKDETSSNHLSQPSGDQVNPPQRQAEEPRATHWRVIGILTTVGLMVVLLATGLSGLSHRKPTPQNHITQSFLLSPTSKLVAPTPVVEFPPLYSGIQWQATKSGELVFPTRNSGSVKLEGHYIESVKVRIFPKDFLAYYERELPKIGWEEIAFAGGGTSGESHGYEKNGHYFLFGVRRGAYQKMNIRRLCSIIDIIGQRKTASGTTTTL